MAKARTVVLDQNEIDLIHVQSIESLQEIGIQVRSKPVLHLREKNEPRVDFTASACKDTMS